MDDRKLIEEWMAMRRRSLAVLPIAAALFLAIGVVVYTERLHRSDAGFVAGILVGTFGYWVVLECLTVVRVGRLLRSAASPDSAARGGPPVGA